jgi:hypothetical protein
VTSGQSPDSRFPAAGRRLDAANEWLAVRQERATLDRPLSYREFLQWLCWHGLPAWAGPLVILVGQVVLHGERGLVLFGGGAILFGLAALAAAARVRDATRYAAGFVAATVVLFTGMFSWATANGDSGVAAWVVFFFFALTSLVVGGAVEVGVENRIDD